MNIKKQLISMNYSKGRTITPQYIVIHETANTNKGADAQAHYKYWNTNKHANNSVHFVVDDKEIIQLAELNWRCWHVGDNKNHSDITNSNSIGIEICVNKDGDYNKARYNCIELVKWLLPQVNLTADKVVRHFDASGKWCPRKMLDTPSLWEDFKKQITNKEHWAEKYYDYLIYNNVRINDKRFDDPITRGEVFALLARLARYKD